MRIRTAIALAGLTLAGVAVSTAPAQAVVPVNAPGVIVGVGFNHEETVALANSPVPAVLGIGLLAGATVVHVPSDSPLAQPGGRVNADMPTIFRDAANAPNGKIVLALVNPPQWNNKAILVGSFR
ncbi:hypothetical protein [Nocardia asiatica]|uniref:hypothetical protein n=1 Tax=Nocardia asiatica TaxID=209252 RepID=UPI0002F661E5|nr:hypothetical protein [Nocardia asiatica]